MALSNSKKNKKNIYSHEQKKQMEKNIPNLRLFSSQFKEEVFAGLKRGNEQKLNIYSLNNFFLNLLIGKLNV